MLTDEQLIQRLRGALEHETAHVDPPPRLLATIHLAATSPRRRWTWASPRVGQALIGLSAAGALTIAVLALLLLGHARPRPNPVRVYVATDARPPASSPHAAQSPEPARVSAAAVAAPLRLRTLSVARYCNAPPMRLVPCRPGQRPAAASPQRLVELSVLARRGAGRHSWYAWNLTAPRGCPQAGAGGPTQGTVPAGARLVFDALIPPGCHGVVRARVLYVSQAPAADAERLALVGLGALALP